MDNEKDIFKQFEGDERFSMETQALKMAAEGMAKIFRAFREQGLSANEAAAVTVAMMNSTDPNQIPPTDDNG